MTLTEKLYGIMFEPAETLKNLAREKPVGQGLLVFIIVVSLNVITGRGLSLAGPRTSAAFLPDHFLWLVGVGGAMLYLVTLLVMSGLYSLLGEVFYGRGNARGLLAAFSFACVPGVLAAPLQYSAVLAGFELGGTLAAALISVWVLVLQVLALRQALALGTSQAVLLFMLPALAVLILIVAITVVAVGTIPV